MNEELIQEGEDLLKALEDLKEALRNSQEIADEALTQVKRLLQ